MSLKRTFAVLFVLALLAIAAAAGVGWWAYQGLLDPYQGYSGDEAVVRIEPGTPSVRILEKLEREGVLRDARVTRHWLVYGKGDPALQAGEYRFEGQLSADQVLDRLIRGDVLTHPVTLVEGLTLEETAAGLAAAGLGEEAAFLAAMRDPSPIADLDPEADDLEGYLFPSTYNFASNTTEATIVATLVETFRSQWREIEGMRAERSPQTVRGLVTLASLVEKEAKLAEERPTIAAVYANRLERGIGLYADPTVIYALKQLGDWDGNIRKPDLKMDHPYNTYVNRGLPPGPIASPGRASLEAAADPADVPYLYFVSRNDGSHVFSETLGEHNRNVNRWQRQYWRDQRQREREEAAAEGGGEDGEDDG